MKARNWLICFLLSMFLLIGCGGGGGDDDDDSSGSGVDLNGIWRAYDVINGTEYSAGTVRITHGGNTVLIDNGQMVYSGQIEGNAITVSGFNSEETITFTGAYNSDDGSITGAYVSSDELVPEQEVKYERLS